MKLSSRITLILSLVITVTTSLVGYFAISQYRKTAYAALEKSLNRNVDVAKSSINNTQNIVQTLESQSQYALEIMILGPNKKPEILGNYREIIDETPSLTLVKKAMYSAQTYDGNELFRSVQLSDGNFLVMALSTKNIDRTLQDEILTLIVFILVIDLLAALIVFFIFQNDNELGKVNMELKKNQQLMEEFVGDASHELRTPVTVIRGYVELLQKDEVASQEL